MSWKKWQFFSDLHYRLSPKGSAKKILLIPGISSPLEVFDHLIPILESRGYEVLSFDFPGRGDSNYKNIPASLPELAHLVRNLLVHVGWDKSEMIVMGFSWGAGLATFLSCENKAQVKLLYLIAPIGLSDSFPMAAFLTGLPLLGPKLLWMDFKKGFEHPESHQAFMENFQVQCHEKQFLDSFQSSLRYTGLNFETLYQRLGKTKLKVKVLAATNDRKFKAHLISYLKNWIPELEFRLLAQGRHMVPLDCPEEIADYLG